VIRVKFGHPRSCTAAFFLQIANSREDSLFSEGGAEMGANNRVKVVSIRRGSKRPFKNPGFTRQYFIPSTFSLRPPRRSFSILNLFHQDRLLQVQRSYYFIRIHFLVQRKSSIFEGAKMAAPAPTSRSREPPQGDEEAAAELKLGEFQDVDALTHSEAALVINALVQKRKMDRKQVSGNTE
jgi:hypothetical protein